MPIRCCKSRLLIDQFDFSLSTQGATIEGDTGSIEYNTFQQCATLRMPNLPSIMVNQNGYFDGSANGTLDKEVNNRLGDTGSHYVSIVIGTDQPIPVVYTLDEVFAQQFQTQGQTKELISIKANWVSRGSVDGCGFRGYLVQYGTISATGAITGIDFSAAGSLGGKAFLHVISITGTATNAAIKIQSDSVSNFAGAADEGTFTFSAVGAYEIDLSGTIGRYVRANCSSLGGATSFLVAIVVCVKGRTY